MTDIEIDQRLDEIFYNLEHTKNYNPSGRPIGVIMSDFDILEAKEEIKELFLEINKEKNEI